VRLRWKKESSETGLRRVGAGPRGSYLHDGKIKYAVVSAHATRITGKIGWYWVAGWGSGVPHMNTCDEQGRTEADAKDAAMAYVRKHIPAQSAAKGGA